MIAQLVFTSQTKLTTYTALTVDVRVASWECAALIAVDGPNRPNDYVNTITSAFMQDPCRGVGFYRQ